MSETPRKKRSNSARKKSAPQPQPQVSSFVSPILFKELKQLAASRRIFFMKCAFVTILLVTVAVCVWGVGGHSDSTDLAAVGSLVFWSMAFTQLGAVVLLTPLLAGGCVSGEREANTLGLLFITRLRAWNVVQDKGLSQIFLVLYTCGLTFPFMSLALLLGGVELWQVLSAFGLVAGSALVCGGVTLFFSTIRNNYTRSVLSSYLYLLLGFGILHVPAIFVFLLGSEGMELNYISVINPFYAMVRLLDWHGYAMMIGWGFEMYSWVFTLAGGGAVYLALVVAASRIIKKAHRRDQGSVGTTAAEDDRETAETNEDRWRWFKKGIRMRPVRVIDEDRWRSMDPVRWLRSLNERSTHYRLAVKILGVLVAALLMLIIVTGADRSSLLYLSIYVAGGPILLLITIIRAATCLSNERQKDRLGILMSSGYRGSDLFQGVYLSLIRSVLPMWLGLIAITGIGALIASPSFDFWEGEMAWWPVATLLPLYINLILLIGIRVSVRRKTNTRAILMLVLLLVGLTGGPYLLAALYELADLFDIISYSWLLRRMKDLCIAQNPLTWLIITADREEMGYWLLTNTTELTFHFIAVISVTAALWYWLRSRFDRIAGRQPETPPQMGLTLSRLRRKDRRRTRKPKTPQD